MAEAVNRLFVEIVSAEIEFEPASEALYLICKLSPAELGDFSGSLFEIFPRDHISSLLKTKSF